MCPQSKSFASLRETPDLRRREALTLLSGAALSFAISPGNAWSAAADSSALRLRAALDNWLAGIVDKGWVVGAAARVFRRDGLDVEASQGWADREEKRKIEHNTIYRIYSMTKPLTAVVVMQLVERGKLSLDQPIADFLPEFAAPRVFVRFDGETPVTEAAQRPITVRHLLTHTSGLSHSFNDGIEPTGALYKRAGLVAGHECADGTVDSLAALSRRIAQIPLAAQPGTRWIYGTSLDIAGRVAEVASGVEFAQLMREQLLAPLRLADTTFQLQAAQKPRLAALYIAAPDAETRRVPPEQIPSWGDEHVVPTGGMGLFSTLADYTRFVRMLMNGGELDGVRVLAESGVRQMMTDQLGPSFGTEPLSGAARFGLGGEVKGLGFGLGGSVLRDAALAGGIGSAGEYSWGGAASTTFWVNRREGLGAVLMTQKLPSGVRPLRDEFRRLVYRSL